MDQSQLVRTSGNPAGSMAQAPATPTQYNFGFGDNYFKTNTKSAVQQMRQAYQALQSPTLSPQDRERWTQMYQQLHSQLSQVVGPDGKINLGRSGANDASLRNLISDIGFTPSTSGQGQSGVNVPTPPAADPGAVVPTRSELPTDVPGQTIPGPSIPLGSDRGSIEQEAAREKQQSLGVLGQQRDIRQSNLQSLMPILQQQADQQFNYDLPGIKEQLQGTGTLSSSALANAVARERAQLLQPQLTALQQYGLNANDQYASGLGGIQDVQSQFEQGGLQRQFSVDDYKKQSDLAREIGASSVPSPSNSIFGGVGSGLATGAATYGSTYALGQTPAMAAAGTAGPYALPLAIAAGGGSALMGSKGGGK